MTVLTFFVLIFVEVRVMDALGEPVDTCGVHGKEFCFGLAASSFSNSRLHVGCVSICSFYSFFFITPVF